MTLAAAFRGTKGGILLCSDQEWNDGGSKREIDKNYRINFTTCSVFISGAGPDSSVIRAWDEIHRCLWEASNIGKDIWAEHKGIIKEALLVVCNEYSEIFPYSPMSLLIVVAPMATDRVPILYYTEGAVLVPGPYYYSVGIGKGLADYLADRLYEPGRLNDRQLIALAAFILREAAESVAGVGMGANLVFIHENGKTMHMMPAGFVKEIQEKIPRLFNTIWSQWDDKSFFPDWYPE
jgi:hypothetical protein